MKQVPPQQPGRNGQVKTTEYPELSLEREAAYRAGLKLVARIDEDLTRGVNHYRNKAGELLVTLDQVVRAILENNLLLQEESEAIPAFSRVLISPMEVTP